MLSRPFSVRAIRCAFRATQVSWLTMISVMPRSSHNSSSSDRSRAGRAG
jgi:hypothetical protein